MDELRPGEYERVRALFEPLRYNLVIDSAIEGNTPARVFADRRDEPATALVWNRMDALLLAGSPDDEPATAALRELIVGTIVPDARRRFIPQLALHYHPEGWEARAGALLAGLHPEKAWRRYYRTGRSKLAWRERIPPGCKLRRIDADLLERRGLENLEDLEGWVRSFWASPGDFIRRGFGFCLLEGEAVASWCLSVYAAGKAYELGLATVPAHRNRGFATLVAAAAVEHCLAHAAVPHWHCWEENRASIAVAEKVGFEEPVCYPVYRFATQA